MRSIIVGLAILLLAACGTTVSTTFSDVGDEIGAGCLEAVQTAAGGSVTQSAVDAFDEAIRVCDSFSDLEAAARLYPIDSISDDVRRYTHTRCDSHAELEATSVCQTSR